MGTVISWDQLNQLASSIARFNIIIQDVKDYCLQDTVYVWENIRIFKFVAKMIPLSKHTVPLFVLDHEFLLLLSMGNLRCVHSLLLAPLSVKSRKQQCPFSRAILLRFYFRTIKP